MYIGNEDNSFDAGLKTAGADSRGIWCNWGLKKIIYPPQLLTYLHLCESESEVERFNAWVNSTPLTFILGFVLISYLWWNIQFHRKHSDLWMSKVGVGFLFVYAGITFWDNNLKLPHILVYINMRTGNIKNCLPLARPACLLAYKYILYSFHLYPTSFYLYSTFKFGANKKYFKIYENI